MWYQAILADYWSAVKNIPQIFQRIAFKKRTLEDELNEALLRGNLRKIFSGFDLLMLGIGITIGGGVWNLTGFAANTLAGPSIMIAYVVAGMACTFAAASYGELAVEYPVAGGAFTYIMVSFGEFPAWMTVANQMTEYLFGMAVVGRNFSNNLALLCGKPGTFFTVGGGGSWSLDYMAMSAVLVVSTLLSVSGRQGSTFISVATLTKLGVILFCLIVGFTRGNAANLNPFLLNGSVNGIFTAASLFMYAMTGFDSVSNAAEEAKNVNTLPWAMIGTTLTSMVIYVLLSLMLSLLLPAPDIAQANGFAQAFVSVGVKYMVYLVSLAAVLGTLTALLVGLYAVSRLVMVVARDWMLPPFLARVSTRTQTPLVAQVFLGLFIGLIALLVPSSYLNEIVSFGQLFSMWTVINAQMFRRYYPDIKLRFTRFGAVEAATTKILDVAADSRLNLSLSTRRKLVIIHMALLSLGALALSVWYTVCEKWGSRTLEIAGCVTLAVLYLLTALSMKLLCPLQYRPQTFHIPDICMPWLPVVAIGLVFFGMANINPPGYYKIGVYNLVVLVIYFLFSLPMSYIKHYKLDFVNTEQMNVVDLEFVNGQWKPSAATTSRLAVTSMWSGGDDGLSQARYGSGSYQPSILQPSYISTRGSRGTAMFTLSNYRQQGHTPSTPTTGGTGSALHTPVGSGLGPPGGQRLPHDSAGSGTTSRGHPTPGPAPQPIVEEGSGAS